MTISAKVFDMRVNNDPHGKSGRQKSAGKKPAAKKPAAKNRPLVTKTAGIINITDKPSV